MRRIDAWFERTAQQWSWLSFGIMMCLFLFAVGSMLNMVWLDKNVSMRAARWISLFGFLTSIPITSSVVLSASFKTNSLYSHKF